MPGADWTGAIAEEYGCITVVEPADPEFPGIGAAATGLPTSQVRPDTVLIPRGGWPVTDVRYPETVINGVPVVVTPAEIDLTTEDQLCAALLHATGDRHPVVVVDMTSTHFCDCAGLHTLIAVYKRAQAEGSELRLVLSADGAVPRVFALTGMDRVIPCFASLEEASLGRPTARTRNRSHVDQTRTKDISSQGLKAANPGSAR